MAALSNVTGRNLAQIKHKLDQAQGEVEKLTEEMKGQAERGAQIDEGLMMRLFTTQAVQHVLMSDLASQNRRAVDLMESQGKQLLEREDRIEEAHKKALAQMEVVKESNKQNQPKRVLGGLVGGAAGVGAAIVVAGGGLPLLPILMAAGAGVMQGAEVEQRMAYARNQQQFDNAKAAVQDLI